MTRSQHITLHLRSGTVVGDLSMSNEVGLVGDEDLGGVDEEVLSLLERVKDVDGVAERVSVCHAVDNTVRVGTSRLRQLLHGTHTHVYISYPIYANPTWHIHIQTYTHTHTHTYIPRDGESFYLTQIPSRHV